jgi:hypothetical protein
MQSVYVYWHINKQILGGKICGCKQLHKNVRNWSQNRRIRRGTTESTWPNGDSVDAHFMQSKTVLWTQGQWRRHASQQLHWRLRRIREVKRCPSSTWQGLRAAVCQTALWGTTCAALKGNSLERLKGMKNVSSALPLLYPGPVHQWLLDPLVDQSLALRGAALVQKTGQWMSSAGVVGWTL